MVPLDRWLIHPWDPEIKVLSIPYNGVMNTPEMNEILESFNEDDMSVDSYGSNEKVSPPEDDRELLKGTSDSQRDQESAPQAFKASGLARSESSNSIGNSQSESSHSLHRKKEDYHDLSKHSKERTAPLLSQQEKDPKKRNLIGDSERGKGKAKSVPSSSKGPRMKYPSAPPLPIMESSFAEDGSESIVSLELEEGEKEELRELDEICGAVMSLLRPGEGDGDKPDLTVLTPSASTSVARTLELFERKSTQPQPLTFMASTRPPSPPAAVPSSSETVEADTDIGAGNMSGKASATFSNGWSVGTSQQFTPIRASSSAKTSTSVATTGNEPRNSGGRTINAPTLSRCNNMRMIGAKGTFLPRRSNHVKNSSLGTVIDDAGSELVSGHGKGSTNGTILPIAMVTAGGTLRIKSSLLREKWVHELLG